MRDAARWASAGSADGDGSGYASGYTSMSFTTQSESVPLVDTCRLGRMGPATVTSDSRTSVM